MMPSSSENNIKPQSSVPVEDTLDESVWRTVGRDLLTIARNTRSVLIPVNWNFKGSGQALANWDLWGPLVSTGHLNCKPLTSLRFDHLLRPVRRRIRLPTPLNDMQYVPGSLHSSTSAFI